MARRRNLLEGLVGAAVASPGDCRDLVFFSEPPPSGLLVTPAWFRKQLCPATAWPNLCCSFTFHRPPPPDLSPRHSCDRSHPPAIALLPVIAPLRLIAHPTCARFIPSVILPVHLASLHFICDCFPPQGRRPPLSATRGGSGLRS